MPVRVTLDRLIVARGLKARDLAAEVGLSETQLSLFRSGKVKGIRFSTLARICAALDCCCRWRAPTTRTSERESPGTAWAADHSSSAGGTRP